MEPMTTKKDNGNRGWVLDQLIMIGQYEAQLSHIDEKLNDLWEALSNETDNVDEMQRLTNVLSGLYEIGRGIYDARKQAEDQVFAEFPEADKTFWCLVKHAATAFVIAEENFHARGFSAEAEKTMLSAAENLGKTVSLALGMDLYGCLRCLDEQMKGGGDAKTEIATL